MTLKPPTMITARLLPGVQIGDGFISVQPLGYRDPNGRMVWRYYIDLPKGEYAAQDLKTHEGTQGTLATLLTFLSAAAESYGYRQRTGQRAENEDLFPDAIVAWAHQNSDEISMLAFELEETPNLIEE